jgi:hypothetical protein
MRFEGPEIRASSALLFDAQCGPRDPINVVDEESEWRVRPEGRTIASLPPRAIATRWRGLEKQAKEFGADTAGDYHVVKIALRSMNIRLSVNGRTAQDGIAMPGTLHVTEP